MNKIKIKMIKDQNMNNGKNLYNNNLNNLLKLKNKRMKV
jgi:hypothetical protein